MPHHLKPSEIEAYLKGIVGPSARILSVQVLGKSGEDQLKGYGYGTPVMIDYEADGKLRRGFAHRYGRAVWA
jgi:hypothetical protein